VTQVNISIAFAKSSINMHEVPGGNMLVEYSALVSHAYFAFAAPGSSHLSESLEKPATCPSVLSFEASFSLMLTAAQLLRRVSFASQSSVRQEVPPNDAHYRHHLIGCINDSHVSTQAVRANPQQRGQRENDVAACIWTRLTQVISEHQNMEPYFWYCGLFTHHHIPL
jgi:hypothetical protein